MKPFLPQNDPNPKQRQFYLQKARKDYEFVYDFLPPMPMLKSVPPSENFSTKYIAERTVETAELSLNMLAVKAHGFWDPLDELQDYEDFFPVLRKPNVMKTYETDDSFAEQRLCGVNPLVLRQIKQMPANFAFTIEELQAKFGNSINLIERLATGNLYVADYRPLAFIQGGTYAKGKKYLPAPIAFFCWRSSGYKDRGQLVPVAIQINPKSGKASPLLTPFDDSSIWFYAKSCVQIADANHHEMSSHLCRTHFVMEPFAVVTPRQLAENHPLRILLKPHFRFMLANNDLARQRLVNRGGAVDELLAGTLQESLQIVVDAYKDWSLDQFALPTELKNRGMDNVENLPHYPYRDDGILLWNAINKFVFNYLELYYKTPADLQADVELQAWARELVAEDGGRVKGMSDRIDTLEKLVKIVTTIIYICGPLHSAVNFPQYEYMGFIPNMPLAAYQPIQESGVCDDRQAVIDFLPPAKPTSTQLSTLFILSAYRYDRLGYYEEQEFEDKNADYVVNKFQQELNVVQRKIELNNKGRLVDYEYLQPRLVLNSISI
ncbi:lipoxygenase family protein [Nodularia sphaerocarpa]|uniref:lipoxygenase family protein n=1 Tax=Nodularia sphaerocarpa TaxID=137816 RepID=UPI001EFB3323|nr:lipoxygenase family protein [Nodularia sphaerocarpa]MDB9375228.1 lipoxygenase family protein [Nodularia sphaerocarpa CS-585]ULP72578.1 Linoleate 9/13-lipoxygenase [Nodularia sphaerocarpa UHCC 0038]